MEIKGRWHFFWESQWRKPTGVAVAVIGVTTLLLGLYALGVTQIADDPSKWPRARDFINFLPWYGWVIGLLAVVCILLFEGGYRATRRRDNEMQALLRNHPGDSANRLFAIDVEDCAVNKSENTEALLLRLQLTLTAFPSQTIEGIYLDFHGRTYEESTGAFVDRGKSLFVFSPTFGQTVYFELPSGLREGTYSAQLVVYVDGRPETKNLTFKY